MKTVLFASLNLLFIFSCFSQTETAVEDVFPQEQSQQKIRIRCSASINDDNRPLLIVDGVPMKWDSAAFNEISPKDFKSVELLEDNSTLLCYGTAAVNGVFLVTTKTNGISVIPEKEHPFKIDTVCNDNWTQQQDLYNAIQAAIPSVSIRSTNSNYTPKISLRGDDDTIVIVDGVRYDASILNALNPSDIESITVSNSIAASNYLLNNQTQKF